MRVALFLTINVNERLAICLLRNLLFYIAFSLITLPSIHQHNNTDEHEQYFVIENIVGELHTLSIARPRQGLILFRMILSFAKLR